MGFITNFIKKKENEIINNSNVAVKELDKDWTSFLKDDAYLIYSQKEKFLKLIGQGGGSSNIPWYFFWNFKLKSRLKNNFEKLEYYNTTLPKYNPNFIIKKKKEYQDLFKKGELTLDDDQQTAIITDDKHNLVVAGAGSGKTEVLITRIAYLIKRKSDTIKYKIAYHPAKYTNTAIAVNCTTRLITCHLFNFIGCTKTGLKA